MSINMDLYPPILESTDLQQAAEINSTIKSDFNFPDDILTELQGISLNDVTGLILEHFGIV
jgi:hypothetical protein